MFKHRLPPNRILFALTLLLLSGIVFSATSTVITVYNAIVTSKVEVGRTLSDLESVYQRRYALIENFVTLVKETKAFEQYQIEVEKSLLPTVASAKASATKMVIEFPQQTAERMTSESRFQNFLLQTLDKLLVMAQHYPPISDPTLKDRQATFDSLTSLKRSLENLEEDVQSARQRFNQSVQAYNRNIQLFPANLFVTSWHFTPLQGFEVSLPVARKDVTLKF